jgi:DNA-binding Lrp family transcriptional regulator
MLSLDDTDRALLRELQRDASRSINELAAAVGLSASPVWRRIRRLQEEGVLERTVALVNREAVGLRLVAFAMISLSHHSRASIDAFEAALNDAPEVQEAYAVTGDRDFIVRVVVEDIDAYQRFLARRLLPLSMIRSINTSFGLRVVKRSTALPVP